ncbi:red Malpighian tubules [Carabus blaptoides fortunei]
MEDGALNEKLSIRNSVKSLKRYGSTSSHTKLNETLVKHIISSADTLQGIALKYGVTTEQIRRANRLWASDSLFLREYLMIPVVVNSPFSPSESSTNFPSSEPISVQSSPPVTTSIAGSLGEKTIDEFLGKIDTSIAITKSEVKKCQGNSEFLSDIDGGYEKRKPAMSRMRLAANNNTTPDLLQTSHAVVMTQGRKVRTSLQRLAQQQDEIFEL